MFLLLHILVALTSVAQTTYLLFSPSKSKLHFTYTFVGLTLISGTYLGFSKPAHLVQTCVTGLIYIGVISAGIISTHRKLERKKQNNKKVHLL